MLLAAAATPEDSTWRIEDIVETRRIPSTAVSDVAGVVAFVVSEPSLETNATHYSLYVVHARGGAEKVAGADFIDDLQSRAHSEEITFRADFGFGVQLFSLRSNHTIIPLITARTALAGGFSGAVLSPTQPARLTGVLAYGWNTDGSRLWYSTLDACDQRSGMSIDDGVRFDPDHSGIYSFEQGTVFCGLTLRVRDVNNGTDTTIADELPDPLNAQSLFKPSTVQWLDAHRIRYVHWRLDRTPNVLEYVTVDVDGVAQVTFEEASHYTRSSPVRLATRVLEVRPDGHLWETTDASEAIDLGAVPYGAIAPLPGPRGRQFIYSTVSERRHGVATVTGANPSRELAPDLDLQSCSAGDAGSLLVCSAEDLSTPPALIRVDVATGATETLFDPNEHLRRKRPLRHEWRSWTNRFGETSSGFVAFPSAYPDSGPYPLIVLSHSRDARLSFADSSFQWQYLVAMFVQRGYLVIGLNEPAAPLSDRDASVGLRQSTIGALQHSEGFSAVAAVDAAAAWAVAAGLADTNRIGIAGYSRGGIVALLAMTQLSTFCVASVGDTNYFNAGAYWAGGGTQSYYDRIFGGPPYDPLFEQNYRRLSPSYRAAQFAGPLLEQFTGATANAGLEMYTLVRRRKLPSEMWVYPHETHIFHLPRSRAAAALLNLDWFDYWLQPASVADDHHPQWANMRREWVSEYRRSRPLQLGPSEICADKLLGLRHE